eukprot:9316131-Alexandrium_andersonii.AAC.1
MEVGALAPESPEMEADEQQLQAAFVLLQRAFGPGKGHGKGGEPGSPDALGGPASAGGAKGAGKGNFQGGCWKCNEVGHRASDCPLKGKGQSFQAAESTLAQPAPEPNPSTGD